MSHHRDSISYQPNLSSGFILIGTEIRAKKTIFSLLADADTADGSQTNYFSGTFSTFNAFHDHHILKRYELYLLLLYEPFLILI